MRKGFHSLVSCLALLVPVVTRGADEGSTTNMVEELKELRARTDALEKKLSEAAPAAPAVATVRAGSAYMNMSFDTVMDGGWSTAAHPSQELELGDHDPQQRGFSLRNAEIAVDGAVDPYLKGFGNIVLKLDDHNETQVELEEAYLLSTSLPDNLQVKAGQFFAAFGRQNAQHPHAWAFVDEPLVLNRMFGGDGLRNVGTQVSWLTPLPFYTELTLGVFDGEGGTAFSFRDPAVDGTHGRTPIERDIGGLGDLLYVPRIASSFELTDAQTLVLGVSGAVGPNDSGADTQTRIYGADAYWKWKSPKAHGGFPFVSWQTEALHRDYEAGADPANGLTAETLSDWGLYSQVLWGYHEGWVVGLRGDYVAGNNGQYDQNDVYRGTRERVAPNLTWYPSEFSKVRLQYNFDHGDQFGDEQSIWCQVEFLLGSHAAHKF